MKRITSIRRRFDLKEPRTMPSSEERRDSIARGVEGVDPAAPARITFEISPEMFAMLRQLSAASDQPIEGVFDRAIALYKASLDALREGKHIGVADQAESLDTEFIGLIPSGVR
jgi:hypothetical protein